MTIKNHVLIHIDRLRQIHQLLGEFDYEFEEWDKAEFKADLSCDEFYSIKNALEQLIKSAEQPQQKI